MTVLLVVFIAATVGLAIALYLQSSTNKKLKVENSKLKNENYLLKAENSKLQTEISVQRSTLKNRHEIIEEMKNKWDQVNAENRKIEADLKKFQRPVDPKTGKFLKMKPEPEQKKVVLKKRLEEAFM